MQTPHVIDDFVEHCRTAVESDNSREAIAGLLRNLLADSKGLATAVPAFEDVEPSARGWTIGGEHTCHQADNLTVMVLDTLSGVLQPPHDHEMNAIIGVFEGREEQRFWSRTDDGIEVAAGRTLSAGDMVVLGARAIHAISAPADAPARAIHVYFGDIHNVERSIFHPETMKEQPMSTDRYDEYCRPDEGGR